MPKQICVCGSKTEKSHSFQNLFEELSYKDCPRGFQLHIVERPLNTAFMILMKPCCNRDVMTRLILPGCGSRNMSSPHDPRLNGTSPPIGNALLYLLMASTADPITIIRPAGRQLCNIAIVPACHRWGSFLPVEDLHYNWVPATLVGHSTYSLLYPKPSSRSS